MTLEKLKSLPLSPALGYKVKKGDNHRCFFRYSADRVAWIEQITGLAYWDDAAVKAIITYEMQYGDFVIFQCCCYDCFTEEAKAIGREYMQRTGEMISNGYFPECAIKMNQHYEMDSK